MGVIAPGVLHTLGEVEGRFGERKDLESHGVAVLREQLGEEPIIEIVVII